MQNGIRETNDCSTADITHAVWSLSPNSKSARVAAFGLIGPRTSTSVDRDLLLNARRGSRRRAAGVPVPVGGGAERTSPPARLRKLTSVSICLSPVSQAWFEAIHVSQFPLILARLIAISRPGPRPSRAARPKDPSLGTSLKTNPGDQRCGSTTANRLPIEGRFRRRIAESTAEP
jgi:hypothetical protein